MAADTLPHILQSASTYSSSTRANQEIMILTAKKINMRSYSGPGISEKSKETKVT